MKSVSKSKKSIGSDSVSINHEQLPSHPSLANLLSTSNCLPVAQGTAAIGALRIHNETNINDKDAIYGAGSTEIEGLPQPREEKSEAEAQAAIGRRMHTYEHQTRAVASDTDSGYGNCNGNRIENKLQGMINCYNQNNMKTDGHQHKQTGHPAELAYSLHKMAKKIIITLNHDTQLLMLITFVLIMKVESVHQV